MSSAIRDVSAESVTTDPTPAVAVSRLARRFGAAYALREVSFLLPRGAVLLVAGPNGSGKTTLLRLLATALRPTSGQAMVFGHDVAREADAVRSLATLVGVAPGLYEVLSARENLAFAAAMSGAATSSIPALLERVGLDHVPDRLVRTYSQGMKRRLQLARAWLRAPRLLLLDEPFNGLDADGVRLVDDLVTETTAAGGSVVLATHEWERGMRLADTVLALEAGRPLRLAPVAAFGRAGDR